MARGAARRSLSLLPALAAFLWVVPLLFFGYFTLIDRWPAADAALAHLGRGPRIVVGVSLQAAGDGTSGAATRSQVYLVVPASLRTLDAYVVEQHPGQVSVQTVRFGLFIFTGVYAVWIGASLWYLLRSMRPRN